MRADELRRYDYSGGTLLYLRTAGSQHRQLNVFAHHVLALYCLSGDGSWLRSNLNGGAVLIFIRECDFSVQIL
jgi:hypothetical protein